DQSAEIGGEITERDQMSITTNLHLDNSVPMNDNNNSPLPSLEDPLLLNNDAVETSIANNMLNSNDSISVSNASYSNKVPIYSQSPIHNDVLGQLSSPREDSIPSFIDASNVAEGSPPYLNASSPTGDAASFMDIAKLTEAPLSFMKSANSSENSNSSAYINQPNNETAFLRGNARTSFNSQSILTKESSPSFNNNTSNQIDDHPSKIYIPPSPRSYETTNSYIPPRNNFDNTPVQNYNETTIENSLVSNDPYNENQGLLDDITSPTSSGGTLNSTAQSSSSSSRPISVLSAQNVPRTPRADMNLPSQVPFTTAPTASINKDAIQQQNPPNIDEFLCPICLQIIKEAFMGRCGHSFCYVCIVEHLDRKKDCPTCGAHLMRDQIFPNFLLNRLLEKASAIATNQYELTPPTQTQQMKEKIMSTDLSVEDIDAMLITLLAKKHKMESAEKELELDVLADFLSNMKSKKEKKLELLTKELECIDKDLTITHEKLKSLGQQQQQQSFIDSSTYEENTRETSNNYIGAQVPNDAAEADVPDGEPHQQGNARSQSSKKRKHTEMEDSGIEGSLIFEKAPSETLDQRLFAKKKRVREHFEDLESCYLSYRLQDTDPQEGGLSKFSDTLSSFTRYGQFRLVNTLRYGDLFGSSSIVSSIEFDRDDEYFATAGVTKKIKIFEYGNIERQLVGASLGYNNNNASASVRDNMLNQRKIMDTYLHYPIKEMTCKSKISCLSWNTYIKAQIASADYDGVVSLWDVNTGMQVMSFDEHEKRAWSVDFSRMDPTKLASGSDDTKVKIWSTTERHSVFTIESKANICCVKFNPDISHYIAFGSADHHVHYYDLRHTREPVFVYKGHRKAVSYVKFLGSNEFVSASTDSTLRLWDTNTNSCVRTFTGHVNEKNFVGLTTTADWIACGSEDNSVFAYYKNLCQPVVRFNFGSINNVTGEETPESDASLFVSSVCWKKNSNTVLAANSQGTIKIKAILASIRNFQNAQMGLHYE
ncbi:10038_t:CDS:10, partial [Ambispora leptoticha]